MPRFRRTRRKSRAGPDLEKGSYKYHSGGTDADLHAANDDDESDNNDKFWKLFLEEAAAEAKWKVGIWKTELDSLLVFAGLFAAVVSAFLIDLRLHLRPDPQVLAINRIAAILANDTGLLEVEKPTLPVRAVGFLWYGSLVATLIGALWGVLAKGWLGEILREPPNNPADRALARWRRDKAARIWYMENVITAVPLLTQIGLAMFLSGFVVQSFGDNHAIGLEVLVYVVLGVVAYAGFTFLPWFRPDCPYRTPLTQFLHLVPTTINITPAKPKNPDDANTGSKIQILVSRLNRSSNDEIFCSAASMLDVKLESNDSKRWFRGVEKHASAIADALSVRLKNFAHRVQTVNEGPSMLSIPSLKGTASSAASAGEVLAVGSLYHSPIEQGITCLRVLLKSIEASMSSTGDRSPWIKQEIDRQWRTSKIFPEAWRLLSLSIHITKLVARNADYMEDDIMEIEWENMIRETFNDMTLRSISGASACRGLLQGQANLRRVCALGLAMFIEIKATSSMDSKLNFFEKDSDPAADAGKVITENLWRELVKIWKNAAVQLLTQPRSEGDEETSFVKLLDHELYQSDIQSSISETILDQLESDNWTTRKQAIEIIAKLMEHDKFQEAVETSGAIPKVIGALEDDDEDVCAAAIRALLKCSEQDSDAFTKIMQGENGISKLVATLKQDDTDVRAAAEEALLALGQHESYESDIKSCIPTILEQMDNTTWRIREHIIQMTVKISQSKAFRETLNNEGIITKLVAKLEDDDSDVRAAAVEALLSFSKHELYRNTVKSSIPTVIKQLDSTESWSIREKAIQILAKLSEGETFQESIKTENAIPKVASMLEDNDSDVRSAAVTALLAFSTQESYQNDINLSIPVFVKQLDLEGSWRTRLEAVKLLMKLSGQAAFQDTMKANGVAIKLIAKLEDTDEDVRTAAVEALSAFGTQTYFGETLSSENVVSNLFERMSDGYASVRFAALQAISTLSMHEIYRKDIKSFVSISNLVKQLEDDSWSTRQEAVQKLTKFAPNVDFQVSMNNEKTVSALAMMLAEDRDEDVRTAVAQAFSVFGVQEPFQKTLKSEKVIAKLTSKLSDSFSSVRSAAQLSILTLSAQAFYQADIKSAIPTIMKQLEDKNWATRQQIIQMLTKLSENPAFQATMKTEMVVVKLIATLADEDEDVRAAAAQALSTFGTKGLFQDRMKAEKAVTKLIGKLMDSDKGVRSGVFGALLALGKREDCNVPEFLQQVVSTLNTIDEKDGRAKVYKLLNELKGLRDEERFLKDIDAAICKILIQMAQQKDLGFICRSIAILTEMADAGLTGKDLEEPGTANKPSRDAIEGVVRQKLVYDKNLSNRKDVVFALSQLAKHNVFIGCMKSAIPGVIEAVSSNDRNVWEVAVQAISALSKQDDFRTDLVPVIQRLIQQLSGWSEEVDADYYPLNLIEAMSSLVEYKEFQIKLRHVVSVLMMQLPNSPKDNNNDAISQDSDTNEIAFYKAACKLISQLCEIEAVGRDLLPYLTPVLSNMDGSLTEELLDLVEKLIEFGRLTMNDRIALASSLRIVPTVPDNLEVQVCKLKIAALLDDAHQHEHPSSEYSIFLGTVLGHGNDTVKSKLSTLVPPRIAGTKSERHSI